MPCAQAHMDPKETLLLYSDTDIINITKKKPFVTFQGEINHSTGLLQISDKCPQLPNITSASMIIYHPK